MNYMWHDVWTKFHQFPCSNSLDMKLVRTYIISGGGGLGRVRLGWVMLS
jgi:hypothetical protein